MAAKIPEGIPRQHWHCIWPQLFTARRNFNHRSRETENLPFIEYLATISKEADEDDGDEDEIEDEDDVPSDEEEDEDAESCNEQSNVRRFMIGMVGEDDNLMSRDQVDLVASFCEKSKVETNEREKKKHVALLDERCMGGARTGTRGFYRPYPGPLTCQGLRERLIKKRFRADSEKNPATHALEEDEKHDAARRIVFITNLDPFAIEALVTTVSLTQAPALQDLFYKHLTGTASIGVTIKSSGFKVFTLDFHIPYYVLRKSKQSWRDTRKKSNGEPLRQFWELDFLSMPTNNKPASTDERYCLYEAMTSVGVTGNDNCIWAVYGFVDTYWDSRESVDGYHGMKGRRRGRADPLANGQINADEPLWDPREYFLKVAEIRTGLALMEWIQIIKKVEREIQQSRTNLFLALSSNDPKAKQEVTNFIRWNLCMTNFLRLLGMKLSDTVAAWDSFRENGIYYFSDASVIPIETVFGKLKAHLQKLRDLEKELREDNPDGLNVHLGLESIEAKNSQQKTARQLEILTVITIIFVPLALAANLFSTTGVLPFTPNLANFTYVLLSLVVLVGASSVMVPVRASVAVPLKWHVWLWQMIALVDDFTTRALRRGLFLRRIREAKIQDLEMCSSNSPLSTNDREQHDLGGLPEGHITWPTTNPPNPTINWETETAPPSSHFSRVRPPIHQRLPFRPFTSIQKILKRFFRPALGADKQRIEWICRCGHELYADLSSRSPEEINRLVSVLQCTDYPTSSVQGSYGMSTLSGIVSPSQANFANRTPSSSSNQSSTGSNSSTIPESGSSACSFGSQEPQNRSYLEICLNTGKYAKTLCEIDLRNIRCDGELFERIRREYFGLRKFRFNFWLLKPSGIHFVKFSVQDSLRVGILQSPLSIPPQQEVDSKRYTYSPCPLGDDPPMPSDIFIHHLTCTASSPYSAWLNRLPKRLDCSILPTPGHINEGWGIHINEGPNWFVIGIINLFLMIISGVTAGLWKLYTDDFQGAFGFAGWIVGVVNALLLVYIARWNGA